MTLVHRWLFAGGVAALLLGSAPAFACEPGSTWPVEGAVVPVGVQTVVLAPDSPDRCHAVLNEVVVDDVPVAHAPQAGLVFELPRELRSGEVVRLAYTVFAKTGGDGSPGTLSFTVGDEVIGHEGQSLFVQDASSDTGSGGDLGTVAAEGRVEGHNGWDPVVLSIVGEDDVAWVVPEADGSFELTGSSVIRPDGPEEICPAVRLIGPEDAALVSDACTLRTLCSTAPVSGSIGLVVLGVLALLRRRRLPG